MTAVSQSHAAETEESVTNCAGAKIDYINNPELTVDEKIASMDQAFYESVNQSSSCNLSNQSSSSSASSSESESSQASNTESVASPIMSGTETEPNQSPVDYARGSVTDENASNESDSVTGGTENGAIPEDIPPADNDDVVAAQIRLAAQIEKDPVKKAKLWNVYRDYKGIPTHE